jgi:hypothetical protein
MNPFMIMKPLGETYYITITNTISTLPTIPDGAERCLVQVETQNVRIKFNATTSVTYCATAGAGGGICLFVNTVATPYYVIEGKDNMSRARFYRDGSSDGFINVVFQGEVQTTAYNGGKA